MLWNRFPEAKPYYLTRAQALEREIPYGTPIYEHGKALAVRRYFPSSALDERLAEFVARNGGASLFERPDWRARLETEARSEAAREGNEGRYETEREFEERVRHELSESKRLLETGLDKRVEAICWPGGSLTPKALELARELGYRRFTLPSAWRERPEDPAFRGLAPRIGSGLRRAFRGRELGDPSPREFVWSVERAFGSRLHGGLGKAALALRVVRSRLGH
jgi:hypothetical protein